MKKLLTVLLAVAMALGTCGLAGCNKANDDPDTLQIFIERFGYGVDFLDDLIEAFQNEDWVKEKYPNLKIDKPQTRISQGISGSMVIAGKMSNQYDLLFTTSTPSGWISRTDGSRNSFENLTEDVYNQKVPGEDILFKDKMLDTIENWAGQDYDNTGKREYYTVPWVNGYVGLLYNRQLLNDMFGQSGWSVPRTTAELAALGDRIIADGRTQPYIYTINVGYWNSIIEMWWAQYQTLDGYELYWKGEDEDGLDDVNVIRQKGKLRATEVLEELIGAPGVENNDAALEIIRSKNEEHNTIWTFDRQQANYVLGKGVFMPNGDWFDMEMRNASQAGHVYDIAFMPIPVISSIVETLEYWSENGREYTDLTVSEKKAYDEYLCKMIDYDDGKTTVDKADLTALYTAKGKSESDLEKDMAHVAEARRVMAQLEGHEAFVPSYAEAKEPAKDFLRFMATDKAIEIFMRKTKGCSTAFDFDVATKAPSLYDDLTSIQKSRLAMIDRGAKTLPVKACYKMYSLGGLSIKKYPTGSYESIFTAENPNDRKTAKELYEWDINYYTAENNAMWLSALRATGKIG